MGITCAAAQIHAQIGEISENLERHYKIISRASNLGVNVLVFPEMSISGYCREEGYALAFTRDDVRLHHMRKLAQEHNMVIIAGAPVALNEKLYIGSFICKPDNTLALYTKQYVHSTEQPYYDASFDYNPTIAVAGEKIKLAICADVNNLKHLKQAKQDGCTLYMPSIFYSEEAIRKGHQVFCDYAKNFQFPVIIANFCGTHWNMKSGGSSAFWNEKGELLAGLDKNQEGLVVAHKTNDSWKASILLNNN